MKVLILTSSFPSKIGDYYGNFIYDLSENLNRLGIDIVVLCPHHVGAELKENMDNLSIYRFPYFFPLRYQKLRAEGGFSTNYNNNYISKLQVPLFIIFELIWAIVIIKKEKVDIINSHWLIPQGLVGSICKRLLKKPHIATLHSSEVTILKRIPLGRTMSQFIATNCDQIISVSKHRATEFMSLLNPKFHLLFNQKTKVIPMGVCCGAPLVSTDTCYLRKQYNIDSKYVVLFIGRLIEVKGCEYLIESFRTVMAHRSDVILLIVGNGPLESKLRKIVLESGLNKSVRFEGFVEHKEIWNYYALADIVVIPSIIDSSGYEEGLPVTLLEALTVGKAVIGTDTKGICEVIRDGENGILVDQKDSKQLADKIVNLLSNDTLRDTLTQNALIYAQNFRWDLIANKYASIMFELTLSKRQKVND